MTDDKHRPTDVGAGYPEDGPPGTGIDPREHAENEAVAHEEHRAAEGDPGQATGNPRAAGAGAHDDDE